MKSILLLALTALCSAVRAGDLPDPIPEDIHSRHVRHSPAWFTRGILYQVQPRAFTPEGTLRAATARLADVAALGVTVIYLWPVTVADDDTDPVFWSHRQKACKLNNPRNPYRTKDYNRVDPEYGTDQDLKAFIQEAHRLGLKVMLDLVYLHCGPTAVFLKEHPDFVLRNPDGSMKTAAWAFPGLNFENPALKEYLWSNMEMWIRDYDADGFRCDVSARVPQAFWEEGRRRIEKIKPDVAMLAEARRSSDQDFAFDADYGFDWLYRAIVPVVSSGSPAILIRDMWTWQHMTRPQGYRFTRYLDNHDIACDAKRRQTAWGEDAVRAFTLLNFVIDGIPFLYNGEEIGDDARHSIFGRFPIRWEKAATPEGQAKRQWLGQVCAFRKARDVLSEGRVQWLENNHCDSVLAVSRVLQDSAVTMVLNATPRPIEVQVYGYRAGTTCFSQNLTEAQGERLKLGPYGFLVSERSGP